MGYAAGSHAASAQMFAWREHYSTKRWGRGGRGCVVMAGWMRGSAIKTYSKKTAFLIVRVCGDGWLDVGERGRWGIRLFLNFVLTPFLLIVILRILMIVVNDFT